MIPSASQGRTHWVVRLEKGRRRVHVHADYHLIEQGCLKFKNSMRGSYPANIMAFAHGVWVSVENKGIEPCAD